MKNEIIKYAEKNSEKKKLLIKKLERSLRFDDGEYKFLLPEMINSILNYTRCKATLKDSSSDEECEARFHPLANTIDIFDPEIEPCMLTLLHECVHAFNYRRNLPTFKRKAENFLKTFPDGDVKNSLIMDFTKKEIQKFPESIDESITSFKTIQSRIINYLQEGVTKDDFVRLLNKARNFIYPTNLRKIIGYEEEEKILKLLLKKIGKKIVQMTKFIHENGTFNKDLSEFIFSDKLSKKIKSQPQDIIFSILKLLDIDTRCYENECAALLEVGPRIIEVLLTEGEIFDFSAYINEKEAKKSKSILQELLKIQFRELFSNVKFSSKVIDRIQVKYSRVLDILN